MQAGETSEVVLHNQLLGSGTTGPQSVPGFADYVTSCSKITFHSSKNSLFFFFFFLILGCYKSSYTWFTRRPNVDNIWNR